MFLCGVRGAGGALGWSGPCQVLEERWTGKEIPGARSSSPGESPGFQGPGGARESGTWANWMDMSLSNLHELLMDRKA